VNSKNIKVIRVGQSGVTGTPDDFETHFTRRRKGSGQRASSAPQPKLQPIKNPSMQDRIEELGLNEQ